MTYRPMATCLTCRACGPAGTVYCACPRVDGPVVTSVHVAGKEQSPLSIDFQSFGPGETPEIRATVVADSHEDYLALRDALDTERPL